MGASRSRLIRCECPLAGDYRDCRLFDAFTDAPKRTPATRLLLHHDGSVRDDHLERSAIRPVQLASRRNSLMRRLDLLLGSAGNRLFYEPEPVTYQNI